MKRLVWVAIAGVAFAQPVPEELDRRIEKILGEEKIPGFAAGIVYEGKVAYARGFGTMKVGEKDKPVTAKTLFHMASITKTFVATSVMQLWEQGKVDLDRPVVNYIPYFKVADERYREIRVREMLSHSSGMPDVEDYEWNRPQYDEGALERYVRSLTGQKLLWAPGTKFRYSNMAFEVLGDLVAKVSGENFDDYVEAHILKPLGMKSSTLLYKKADPALLADGYTKKKGEIQAIANYPYNRAHTPSSNLHSNVEDMLRYAMANLNRGELEGRRILKESTYEVMWKPAADTGRGGSVGVSWFLQERKGKRIVSHSGGDDGFATLLVLFPEKRAAVVFMVNCDNCKAGALQPLLLDAVSNQALR